MNELVLNDATVAAMLESHEAELEKLRAPASVSEAQEFLNNASASEISRFLPKGTVAGEIRRAKKQGQLQSYGFVSSSSGDIFVSPSMMREFNDGERVACMAVTGQKGLVADKLAGLDEFIEWHKDEIIVSVRTYLNEQHADQIRWYGAKDPSYGWEEMKAKCKALGITLIEVRKVTKSVNYGGRGVDTYKFADPVTHEQAGQVLDVLGTRHAEPDNGYPYDHGHDNICITPDLVGFENSWCGPTTD